MAEVRWTRSAADDIRAIEDWISRDSPIHAAGFVDRLIDSTTKLKRLPLAGRIVPEFNRRDVREVVHRSYRVAYLLRSGYVTILRVVHLPVIGGDSRRERAGAFRERAGNPTAGTAAGVPSRTANRGRRRPARFRRARERPFRRASP